MGGSIARLVRQISQDVELVLAGRHPDQDKALAHELSSARTAHLDLENASASRDLDQVDLIVAALHDSADALLHAALAHGIAHIGITKLADDVPPIAFAALRSRPKLPIILLGHWQAGVLTIVARQAAEQFGRADSIEAAALYDARDPVGPMVASELDSLVGRASLREGGSMPASTLDASGYLMGAWSRAIR